MMALSLLHFLLRPSDPLFRSTSWVFAALAFSTIPCDDERWAVLSRVIPGDPMEKSTAYPKKSIRCVVIMMLDFNPDHFEAPRNTPPSSLLGFPRLFGVVIVTLLQKPTQVRFCIHLKILTEYNYRMPRLPENQKIKIPQVGSLTKKFQK